MSGKRSIPRSGPPAELRFAIGGFPGGTQEWVLEGESLTYRAPDRMSGRPAAAPVQVIPSAEAWEDFWAACERAGVQRWGSSYPNPGILDGTQWELRIAGEGFELEAWGSNAYPDREGRSQELDSSRGFDDFVAAMERLVGDG
jgi:hypothetical protein